jgi:hypothetical protein
VKGVVKLEKITLSPNEHDRIVREEALKLLHDGFDVQARLGGWFKRPAPVHGYRPDIFASKDGKQLIVEVTKGSIDWPKTSALERYAHENPDIEVRILPPTGAQASATDAQAKAASSNCHCKTPRHQSYKRLDPVWSPVESLLVAQ